MKIGSLQETIEGLDSLGKSEKVAILKIIDLKTEDDMQKVLDKIDARFNEVTTQFNGVNAQLSEMKDQFIGVDHKFSGLDHRIGGLEHKMDTLQKLVWGALITILILIIGSIIGAMLRSIIL